MEIKEGFCRIVIKDGSTLFGEVKGTTSNNVAFSEYTPIANIKNLDKANIVEYEPCDEDDIPPYE